MHSAYFRATDSPHLSTVRSCADGWDPEVEDLMCFVASSYFRAGLLIGGPAGSLPGEWERLSSLAIVEGDQQCA